MDPCDRCADTKDIRAWKAAGLEIQIVCRDESSGLPACRSVLKGSINAWVQRKAPAFTGTPCAPKMWLSTGSRLQV